MTETGARHIGGHDAAADRPGRTRRAAVPVLVAGLVFGCRATDDGEDPAGSAAPPESFAASIGGFLGESYRVELQPDGTLLYLHNPQTFTSYPGTKRRRIRVTADQWRAFRQELDAAGVWTWKGEYRDPGLADGTQWSLKAVYPDAVVSSHGSNAYPPDAEFRRFVAAVRNLLGGRGFR